jgi:NAD(P)-dependent dehydrogenase (short-subunit alcohol dehydrogenase family)
LHGIIIITMLTGKIALVTGAKGGLGTAVTRAFLDAGATVIGVSRSISAADFPHPNFIPISADLTRPQAGRDIVTAATAHHPRIDILVHVMGAFAGGQPVDETADDTLNQMMTLNFYAAFYVARAIIPVMRAQRWGRILTVASRQGVEPAANISAYNASKAALVSLTKTIALELKGSGITANTVLPGAMATPSNSGANLVDPAQVAAMLVYLASDNAAGITGAAIPIYGVQ